ncbi:hypothetical protein CNR22_15330 [Sphingobacteriaceae bacterium]|nr:hypothetical protein CNR22_15330 [Sphingobacteriaceae bacterium]
MLKALVIDDEIHAQEALVELLKLYHPDIKLCDRCSSISTAVAAITKHQPDIVFLDVELENENGFALFQHFPSPVFKVIFITAHQGYALGAFRFAALDYLLKPVDSLVLADALKKAFHSIDLDKVELKLKLFAHNINASKADKKIILKTTENIHLVSLADIIYCQADRGYTSFYLADKTRIVVSSTIGDFEAMFADYGFFRIHQTYLLNLQYFKRYEKTEGGKAVLKNNVSLPVSTRKKELLLQKLSEL